MNRSPISLCVGLALIASAGQARSAFAIGFGASVMSSTISSVNRASTASAVAGAAAASNAAASSSSQANDPAPAPASSSSGSSSGIPSSFSAASYLASNPDVAEAANRSGTDPAAFAWKHYQDYGIKEQRTISSAFANVRSSFDPNEYLAINSDVAKANMDPWEHFQLYGNTEGRTVRKSATDQLAFNGVLKRNFDSQAYYQANPDVARAGVDAFQHYLMFGRKEGRAFTAKTANGAPSNDSSASNGAASNAIISCRITGPNQYAYLPQLNRDECQQACAEATQRIANSESESNTRPSGYPGCFFERRSGNEIVTEVLREGPSESQIAQMAPTPAIRAETGPTFSPQIRQPASPRRVYNGGGTSSGNAN